MTLTADPPRITARTVLYGLLGHPVSHSLSPAMHNAALAALGMDARYLAFEVLPEDLGAALAGARALGIRGLNVTVPHKEPAVDLAEQADPVAALIGAANTLVPVSTGWRAYNTDAEGFLQAVEADLAWTPQERRGLILGAGGAARAAAVSLAREGAQEIILANRNGERARRLARDLSGRLDASIRAVALESAPEAVGEGDLLVSATPLGLHPGAAWPWDLSRVRRGVRVYDMAYRSGEETALVLAARSLGFRAASGRSMLLHQGALAFSLWTGEPAPIETMKSALSKGESAR